MAKKFGKPDNAELFFKCSSCGNMFEPSSKGKSNCPICGNVCTEESCKMVDGSNEGY